MGETAVAMIQPAAADAALGMGVHEPHHLRHTLLEDVEQHVGVQQQHVPRALVTRWRGLRPSTRRRFQPEPDLESSSTALP